MNNNLATEKELCGFLVGCGVFLLLVFCCFFVVVFLGFFLRAGSSAGD